MKDEELLMLDYVATSETMEESFSQFSLENSCDNLSTSCSKISSIPMDKFDSLEVWMKMEEKQMNSLKKILKNAIQAIWNVFRRTISFLNQIDWYITIG